MWATFKSAKSLFKRVATMFEISCDCDAGSLQSVPSLCLSISLLLWWQSLCKLVGVGDTQTHLLTLFPVKSIPVDSKGVLEVERVLSVTSVTI